MRRGVFAVSGFWLAVCSGLGEEGGTVKAEESKLDLTVAIKGQTIKDIYVDSEEHVLIELGSGIYLKFPLTKDFQIGVPMPRYVN
jgi:hypothetical protein